MNKQRRRFSPELKVAILRSHFVEHRQVPEVCKKFSVHRTVFYRWRRQFFENGSRAFKIDHITKSGQRIRQQVRSLEARFARKHHFLSEREWLIRLLQGAFKAEQCVKELNNRLGIDDANYLLECIQRKPLRIRNKALAIFAYLHGMSDRHIAHLLLMGHRTITACLNKFNEGGIGHVFARHTDRIKKADDERYKKAVFAVLHAPPKTYGINRTTWRLKDIQQTLKKKGVTIALHNIREIIRKAGFRFRKAKKVLTSTDPEYKAKPQIITNILKNLKPNEKFFSVDEFGPFAVKIQGGKSLMKNGQLKTVPQHQKSKGSLVVTGALELSENQITHFYSQRKNTDEMIKLLNVLIEKYANQARIYFSWDAASWHASKKLNDRVAEINDSRNCLSKKTPEVKLAPLPSCAQFLNVIESVFSGMAKAVIHNSDYESVTECTAAIDRHFAERNQHFSENPKRAGDKIWGNERVVPSFQECNNCKDPRW